MTLAATTIPITISLITAVCRGEAHDFLMRRDPGISELTISTAAPARALSSCCPRCVFGGPAIRDVPLTPKAEFEEE
jgi:hypothetical protein